MLPFRTLKGFPSPISPAQTSVPTKMGTFSRETGEEKATLLLLACFSLEKDMHVWYHDKKGG